MELTSLKARRAELAEEISESQPSVHSLPSSSATSSGRWVTMRCRKCKAVMQAVVAEVRVRDRGHIQPSSASRSLDHRMDRCTQMDMLEQISPGRGACAPSQRPQREG